MKDDIQFFWRTLKGSCFSFDFYKSAAKQPLFHGFLYVLSLMLVIMCFSAVVLYIYVQKDLKPFLKEVSALIPDCSLQKGIMSCSSQAPVVVEHHHLALAVYTGGEKGELDRIVRHLKAKNSFIIAKEHLIIKDGSKSVAVRWSDIGRLFAISKITGKHFETMLPHIELYLIPTFFFLCIFFLLWNIMQVLYFTAFGYLFSRISELKLQPKDRTMLRPILNIAVYASSPATVLLFILLFFIQLFYLRLKLDHLQLLYMMMYATFFLGGYHAYRSTVKLDNRRQITEDR